MYRTLMSPIPMQSRTLLSLIILLSLPVLVDPVKNGFDLAGALIPSARILPGGPPRDGIASIDRPLFLPASKADALEPDDRVLGLRLNDQARAYPIAILNWHEIVNDRFDETPIAVTYCPLCGTGMAFLARAGRRALTFGVSGLLYNSDVLLYDRQSQSLWSQIDRRAISGPHKGRWLEAIPLEHTTWGDWRTRHPDTLVLSRETGHARDYDRDPYGGYARDEAIYFPVRFRAQGYHPKERVLGIEIAGQVKAYHFAELAKSSGLVHDRLGEQAIVVRFDAEHQNATAVDARGKPLPGIVGFWFAWFAWFAFHPDTLVYKAKPR